MIDLPVGSKPAWELDQEDPLPLKNTAERSVSFVYVLFTRPWLTPCLVFSFFIHSNNVSSLAYSHLIEF